MNGLVDKRIVIAGGATGIGAATAHRLAESGAAVVVGDINLERATQTADEIVVKGGRATPVQFDLSDDASVNALIEEARTFLGGIDGLFNVGAEMRPVIFENDLTVLDTDMEVWRRTIDVNLLGYGRTIRAVLPHLLEAGSGSIVNTSSGAAFVGLPNRIAYSVSKAGVNALTRHVASRWGREGIRCNTVMPGLVLSETQQGMGHTEVNAKVLQEIRHTRLGQPSDIAATAAFLLSDDGEWINGQAWSIDGGLTIRA